MRNLFTDHFQEKPLSEGSFSFPIRNLWCCGPVSANTIIATTSSFSSPIDKSVVAGTISWAVPSVLVCFLKSSVHLNAWMQPQGQTFSSMIPGSIQPFCNVWLPKWDWGSFFSALFVCGARCNFSSGNRWSVNYRSTEIFLNSVVSWLLWSRAKNPRTTKWSWTAMESPR